MIQWGYPEEREPFVFGGLQLFLPSLRRCERYRDGEQELRGSETDGSCAVFAGLERVCSDGSVYGESAS